MKRTSLILVLLALAGLVLLPRASADPAANPLAVLDADRAAMKSLTMVADIETPKSGDRWAKFPMNFWYSAPNMYRSEIKTGGLEGDLIAVADGKFVWSYPTKTKKVTKTEQALIVESIQQNGPTDLLTVLATPTLTFTSLFNLVSAAPDAAGNNVLTVTPKIAVASYDKIQLTTTADGKTPVSALAYKGSKVIARVTFKTYERNGQVAAERFTFTVPPGVQLVEQK